MPQRTLQKNSVLRVTEFEVREIDSNGECTEVHHHETPKAAKAHASELLAQGRDGTVAVVVERHVQYFPHFAVPEPDQYTTLLTLGDEAALREGGWL